MDYISIQWAIFIEHKWLPLEHIATPSNPTDLLPSKRILDELVNKLPEVLIALTFPSRNFDFLFDRLSRVLTEECITLGNPSLRAVYRIKLRAQLYLEVAVLEWCDVLEEGGLIAWTTPDSTSIILLVNDEQMFNMLSDFHIYCHGRQQQNEQLNREAAKTSLELQHILNIPLHLVIAVAWVMHLTIYQ